MTSRPKPVFRAGLLVVVLACVAAGVAAAGVAIDAGAEVTRTAVRGRAFQATDTIPPPVGCRRVIVVGDSLTDNSRPWLVDGLRNAGFTAHVDAHPSRRIPSFVGAPYSGVRAAWDARATFGEADCWVVALGSNDLIYGRHDEVTINAWIDEMLAAVSPGALVWWVNVDYHHDPRTSFDFVRATAMFNRELGERAAVRAGLAVIDWHSLAEANLQWFFDPVHVDRTGSIARAHLVVAALPAAS